MSLIDVISHFCFQHTGLLVEQAWLCEFVLITNVRTSRSWYFPCNVWLSLFEPGDGSLSVELYPRSGGLRDNNTLRDRPESTGKLRNNHFLRISSIQMLNLIFFLKNTNSP